MKKIIAILLIFISNTILAQTIKPAEDFYTSNYNDLDNIYFKDVNNTFNKFLGTWEYNNDGHYVKVVVSKLIKVDVTFGRTRRQYRDMLVISYLYKYNGVIVYNTIPPVIPNPNTRYYYIDGHIIENSNKVSLDYNEPSTTTCSRTKNAEVNLTKLLTFIGQPEKIKWERVDLRESQGFGCDTGNYDTSDFKIPANMILTKIN